MTAGSTIFNNKLNINVGATFDPYSINNNGVRIDKLNILNGGALVRMTSANINMSYSIDSKSLGSIIVETIVKIFRVEEDQMIYLDKVKI